MTFFPIRFPAQICLVCFKRVKQEDARAVTFEGKAVGWAHQTCEDWK